MANKDYSPEIRELEVSLSYYPLSAEKLSPDNLKILSKAYSLYAAYCEPLLGYSLDPRIVDVVSFQKLVKISEITDLISKLTELNNQKEQKHEPKHEATSIPPELEAMVAEYQQNKATLDSEEIKASAQKTVAEQVKIAIAHKKIKDLALANKEGRISKGESFRKTDDILVSLGSPKSQSATESLSSSYDAVKQVAFTYSGFSKLSPQLQNEIITSAVDLNTVGVSDIDTAIQASTLQIDISAVGESEKKYFATIPGGFISTVYHEIVSQDQKTAEYNTKITVNEEAIVELQKQGKIEDIKALIEENQHLQAFNESQSTRLTNNLAKLSASFQDFEKSRETRLSQDPDLKDVIEIANKNVASIQYRLISNHVKAHIYTPSDDAHLLEQAIRNDMPGVLLPNAGYEAEHAAALINSPQTQDPNLSPQAILLAGKELTPDLLTKARLYAQANPDSSLGKLFKTRKDIFDSIGVQIRKISGSPLGKEITVVQTGIGKVFYNSSKFFGKISDKIPGGFGGALRIVQNPWGSLRSWAGRKAGELIVKRISQSLTNETLKKGAEMLLQGGLKETVKKLAAQAAAKAAIKLGAKVGTKIALETAAQAANVIPGLGIILAVAIDVIFWIGDKFFGAIKSISKSIYGEEIKARDLLAIPAAGVTAGVGAVATFVTTLATATAVAAGSAVGIIVLGTIIGIFFYITSVVVAPLISTLVQLETRPSSVMGCASWPTAGEYLVLQGPLGTATHSRNSLQAIDIDAKEDTGYLAAAQGKVVFSGPLGTYGNTVFIEANTDIGSITMLYAHMNDIVVKMGQSVEVGDTVGTVGGTGGWSPHIHFEYLNGVKYNSCPAGDIPVPEGCNGSNCLYNGQLIYTNVTTP
jgi:murein DD-endopeptidase MepM/ murein hydrolase activator NlpD